MEQEKETVEGRAVKIASKFMAKYVQRCILPEKVYANALTNETYLLARAADELVIETEDVNPAGEKDIIYRALEIGSQVLGSYRVQCLPGCSCERPGRTCKDAIKHLLLELAAEELAFEEQAGKDKKWKIC